MYYYYSLTDKMPKHRFGSHTHTFLTNQKKFVYTFYIYAELDCGEKPDKKKKQHKKHHKRGHAAKRIVNGTIANPGEWPWQVLLQWENGSALLNQSFCGGAILSKHFILTAGHCIDGGRLSRVVLTASTIYSPKREKNTSLKSFCKTMDLQLTTNFLLTFHYFHYFFTFIIY